MESLYLLIPIAIIIVAIAITIFFWAVKSGQYDDLDTEGHRILFDDPPVRNAQKSVEGGVEVEGDVEVEDDVEIAESTPVSSGKAICQEARRD